jgi:hypothetical protein
MIRVLLVFIASAGLPGCEQHEPFCDGTVVMCVESCDTGAFLQCDRCPEGSMPVDACDADAGP